ncbi:hypothetical protein PRZ48_014295 [Zasmidium cellare]|uniref:AMP-dependent synthetase/ligase domain-containing protein n=1 Tax=Zasmidium cellare TaxID=395010 RepID=A0ABR0E0U4_ZASCE|nr:hypothetical protein PRZ48_014295 [Zasmidium cellare]
MPISSRLSTPLPEETIPTWLFGAPSSALPETPLIIDAADMQRHLSMSTYRRQAQRFAQGFINAGFKTGDAVLFVTRNNLACPVIYMGTWMAGGRCTGTYPSVPVEYITHLVEDTDCKCLLADEESYKKCVEALGRVPGSLAEKVFLIDDEDMFEPNSGEVDGHRRPGWNLLLGPETQGQTFDWRQHCYDPDQIACLNYTSGSTGPPKGVIMTHRTILASCAAHLAFQRSDPDEVNWVKRTIWLTWMPIVFSLTLLQAVINGPHRGIKNYVMPGIDVGLAVKYIKKYRPTQFVFSPAMAREFLNHPEVPNADLSSVTRLDVGGQAMPQALKEQLLDAFKNANLLASYGMTE